jgi:hypothetical protein
LISYRGIRRSSYTELFRIDCLEADSPMPAPLADILDKAPIHAAVTLCANSRGTPWTLSGFRASWRTLRIHLEKEGRISPALTLYGLRHTVAVILRECG